jgi:hypothetical protein
MPSRRRSLSSLAWSWARSSAARVSDEAGLDGGLSGGAVTDGTGDPAADEAGGGGGAVAVAIEPRGVPTGAACEAVGAGLTSAATPPPGHGQPGNETEPSTKPAPATIRARMAIGNSMRLGRRPARGSAGGAIMGTIPRRPELPCGTSATRL